MSSVRVIESPRRTMSVSFAVKLLIASSMVAYGFSLEPSGEEFVLFSRT